MMMMMILMELDQDRDDDDDDDDVILMELDQDRDDETRTRLESCPVTEFSMSDFETLDCFPTDIVGLIGYTCIMRSRVL